MQEKYSHVNLKEVNNQEKQNQTYAWLCPKVTKNLPDSVYVAR